MDTDFCPYVGLEPFTWRHAEYFFGRDVDADVIADNLLARRVSVLYGTSGVGKSSVLNVGLPLALARIAGAEVAYTDNRWLDPAAYLSRALRELGGDGSVGPAEVASRLRESRLGPICLVLDQFEEFFLYRARAPDQAAAYIQLIASLLAVPDLDAHVLISLRADALHLLNGLRARIPAILDTTIELSQLREESVREAITRPIDVYNDKLRRPSNRPPVFIEPRFSGTLISELRAESSSGQIELAYLQLVLKRVWEEEGGAEAVALRTGTLTNLNGAGGIVRQHVSNVMEALSDGQRLLAVHAFHYMVTPSGGKLAYLPDDLASLISETTGRSVEGSRVEQLLGSLAGGKSRILRNVDDRYELLHDILARPLLDWRVKNLWEAPFAYFVDLFTGHRDDLSGQGTLFQRHYPWHPRGPLQLRHISRNHMLVLGDSTILDLRSRFGTTINANPLPFGEPLRLQSGDIVALANTAAVRFWTVEDFDTPPPEAPPQESEPLAGHGWAMLIDGEPRKVVMLAGDRCFLSIGSENAIEPSPERTRSAFAMVELEGRTTTIEPVCDEPALEVVVRVDAYRDQPVKLWPGQKFEIILRGLGEPGNPEGAFRGVFRVGGRPFEIIRNMLVLDPEAWEDDQAGASP